MPFPGAFANRVYPALTVVDAVQNSYGAPGDASKRLQHELADPASPAQYVPFGRSRRLSRGDLVICDEIDLCDADFHRHAVEILESGDLATNYPVQPGDVITIPERAF